MLMREYATGGYIQANERRLCEAVAVSATSDSSSRPHCNERCGYLRIDPSCRYTKQRGRTSVMEPLEILF